MQFLVDFIKDQAKRMSQMSEEEIKRTTSHMPNIPGMPPGSIDPNMLKNYSNLIGNMDDSQLNNMAEMAKNMGFNPGGQMPNFNNPYANQQQAYQPSQSGSSVPKTEDPFSDLEKKKFDRVNEIKNDANKLFKEQKLDKASEK